VKFLDIYVFLRNNSIVQRHSHMASFLIKEPIYQQLNSQLRLLIGSGESPIGSQFLTERQICERYEVSRATANKALSNLVSEGLLEFRKGVGTFVRGRPLDYNLRALVSFTDKALAAGKQPGTEVLRFESVRAEDVLDDVPQVLQVGPTAALYYIERLRLADGSPVILEKRYVVAEYCPELTAEDVRGSLYSLWIQRYHLPIEGADQSIRAVNARGADARLLKLRDGAAGMLIRSVGHLTGNRPLWSERTLYRADSYEFHNRLGGIQPAGYSTGQFLDVADGTL
jgi:GntR family transcriptional regulator